VGGCPEGGVRIDAGGYKRVLWRGWVMYVGPRESALCSISSLYPSALCYISSLYIHVLKQLKSLLHRTLI
jgi:hypothetical protein